MVTYKYLIPIAPVTKKNSPQIFTNRKTGKPFVAPSKPYKAYEEQAAYYLTPKPPAPIDYPVTVKCVYYMPTKRKVDTANLNAAIHDILVKYGILADDNRDIIASTDGTRTYYSKTNPRAEVEISPYKGEYEQWKKQ